jgi:hypothetical protein
LQPDSLFERKQGIFWSEQGNHPPEQGICRVGERHAKPHRLRAAPRIAGERPRRINDGRYFQNSKHVKAAYSELSGLSRGSASHAAMTRANGVHWKIAGPAKLAKCERLCQSSGVAVFIGVELTLYRPIPPTSSVSSNFCRPSNSLSDCCRTPHAKQLAKNAWSLHHSTSCRVNPSPLAPPPAPPRAGQARRARWRGC